MKHGPKSPRASRPKRKPANDNKKRKVEPVSSRYMLGIAGVGLLAALVAISMSEPPTGISIAELPYP